MYDPTPYYPYPPAGVHPSNIGFSQGYIPNWNDFWNMASYFMGAQQGQIKPIPGGFNVPYGTDYLSGVLNDMTAPQLSSSRGFAYRADSEAFSRTVTSIINNISSNFNLELDDKQKDTIRKVADMIDRYGTPVLDTVEKMIAKDVNANYAHSMIGMLRDGLNVLRGPGGSRVPLYSALNVLGENMPLEQRDAFLMHMMYQMSPVNGELPGGYSYRQAASIMSAAAGLGYNALNNIDTDISREAAASFMEGLASSTFDTNVVPQQIIDLAEQRAQEKFGQLAEAGTFNQALYTTMTDGINDVDQRRGTLAAANQFSKFIDVRNRLRSIEGIDGSNLSTFADIIAQKENIQKLSSESKDKNRKEFLDSIVKDISSIEKNVSKDFRSINIDQKMKDAREQQRSSLKNVTGKIGIYSDNAEMQDKFVEAMLLRDELSSYKNIDLAYLAEDAVDENGNVIEGKKNWQVRAEKANKELKTALTNYFGSGLHDVYTNATKNLQDADAQNLFNKLKSLNGLTPEEAKAAIENDKDLQAISNDANAMFQAKQVSSNYKRVLRAASPLQRALANNGTPIENEEQLMSFINKITYGGVSNMSTEELAHTVEQIGAGMLASGASGNDVMQMAGRGAEAAMAIGGDAQFGAIQGLTAGLAARAASKNRNINPEIAQELGSRAGGRATKSLVTQTYATIGTYLNGKDIDLSGNKYADLINKIRHNQTLTQDEIDQLYRNSGEILTSIGMSSDEQVAYLNRLYEGGDIARAAAIAGTQHMMSSTNMRDIMKDNIQAQLRNQDLSEQEQTDLSAAIVNSMSKVSDIHLLKSPNRAEDYKNFLKKQHPELAEAIDKIPADLLQTTGMNALTEGSNYNGESEEKTLASMSLSEDTGKQMELSSIVGAMTEIMPDINKSALQNISAQLSDGTFEGLMKAMATSLSDANLSPEAQKKLFHAAAAKTILDDKDAGKAGLNEPETAMARKLLHKLYKGGSYESKNIALVHKWLAGEELSSEEEATLAEIKKEGEFNDTDEEALTELLEKSVKTVQRQWDSKKEIKVDKGEGDEVEEVREPESTEPSEPGKTAVSTPEPSGSKVKPDKPKDSEDKTEEGKSTVTQNGQLGTSGNPMVVEIKGLVAGSNPLPVNPK